MQNFSTFKQSMPVLSACHSPKPHTSHMRSSDRVPSPSADALSCFCLWGSKQCRVHCKEQLGRYPVGPRWGDYCDQTHREGDDHAVPLRRQKIRKLQAGHVPVALLI